MRNALLSFTLSAAVVALVAGCSGSGQESSGGGAPPAPPSGGGAAPGGGAAANGPGGGAKSASTSGADLFSQNCQGCHGAGGKGGARGAPPLTEAASWDTAKIKGIIADGKGRMPSFKSRLSDEQQTALADYVKTLGGGAGAKGGAKS